MSTEDPPLQADRLERALAAFDAANAEDPNRELHEGEEHPKELLYARRMSDWVTRLEERPSEALLLAARSQHLCRFRLPRSGYPQGRSGYLAWRNAAKRMHAELAREILEDVGYDEDTIVRVGELLEKRKLRIDPEVQTLEDAACLVFLERHLADFAEGREEEQLVDILRKTWKKMTPRGHEVALALPLDGVARDLLERALSSPGDAS